ncbi:MAG TPA: GNAT family N-acetyltransferase [Bacilli bacterium]|nr:GNAT family N-acetyltransferase [Bacilli bacterium]
MPHYTVRPMQTPEDYAAVAALLHTEAEELALADETIPQEDRPAKDEEGRITGFYRERVVAVDEEGNVVGYAASWRAPWAIAGTLGSHLIVDPSVRGRGVGRLLYDHLEAWCHKIEADVLFSELKEGEPDALAFVERRGFAIDRHLFTSTLHMDAYDEAKFAGVVDGVKASGIRFAQGEAVWEQTTEDELYQLFADTCRDNPAMLTPPLFDEWRDSVRECPPQYLFVAFDGDRPVGLTQQLEMEEDGLYNEYTGVHTDYRGRHIALALKLLLLEEAKRYDVTYMQADNDSENLGMLAVNSKLGFVPNLGNYRIMKDLRK